MNQVIRNKAISFSWLLLIVFVGLGTVFVLEPSLGGERFAYVQDLGVGIETFRSSATQVVNAMGWSLLLLCVILVIQMPFLSGIRVGTKLAVWSAVAVGCYLLLTLVLANWLIDDAAITFAYSRNLVLGNGLVLHPNHLPEEAYSNTLWMLFLALANWLGGDIPTVAKAASTALGAVTLIASFVTLHKLVDRSLSVAEYAIWLSVSLGAPFLIWSVSGLEHALQAFLFISMVLAARSLKNSVWIVAVCLSCLMLLRPETPLIVGCVGLAYLSDVFSKKRASQRKRDFLALSAKSLWPLAVLPVVTGAALLTFRLIYFGDPLPNPYYAKASSAQFISLLNVAGGGWDYIISWATANGFLLLIPVIGLCRWPKLSLPMKVLVGILAGQVTFIVFASGDWMSTWRFISPMIPLLAVLSAYAWANLPVSPSFGKRVVVPLVLVGLLSLLSARQLVLFSAKPSTPYLEVAAQGHAFATLAEKLNIEDPTLAYHDAGGVSYSANLDLIDLAGLGNRFIAKNMYTQPEKVTEYILEKRRPDFVFGQDENFAAETTQFHKTERFLQAYIPVEFPDQPVMERPLSHIRAEHVEGDIELPSDITLVREGGKPVKVVVSPSAG